MLIVQIWKHLVVDIIAVSLLNLRLHLQSGTNANHVRFAAEIERTFKKIPIKNFAI